MAKITFFSNDKNFLAGVAAGIDFVNDSEITVGDVTSTAACGFYLTITDENADCDMDIHYDANGVESERVVYE